MRLVFAFLLAPALAHADSLTVSTRATDTVDHRFAIGVNEPIAWSDGSALGVSGYVAVTQHQVIRLNLASWSHEYTNSAGDFAGFLISGDAGDGTGGGGRYTDFGAAWMYFPRRAFDGPSIELGALLRRRSTWDYTVNDDFSDDTTTVQSTLIGARSVVGWSWLMYDRVFISLQAGVSAGREYGSQVQTRVDEEEMPVTSSVHQTTVSAEAFMRFGVVL